MTDPPIGLCYDKASRGEGTPPTSFAHSFQTEPMAARPVILRR